jgi:beta-fructofuranosidase
MWECPDFALCDGKALLFVSPMEMLAKGTEYPNGRSTICLIGSYDESTDTFTEETDQIVDSGIDFYASQTMKAPDGRTIMVGWMANWDVCEFRQPKEKWYGMMTLPRELSVREGRLYQAPVRELEQLRTNPVVHQNVTVDGKMTLDGVRGRCADLVMTVRPGADTKAFTIRFAENEKHHVSLTWCPEEGVVKLDRRFSGSRQGTIHRRECQVGHQEELKIRLVLDRFSAEAFIGEGERTMTATFFTEQTADGISFESRGASVLTVEKYDLEEK